MVTERSSPRFQTHKTAHIVLDGGENLIKCSIRNLSDTGAALAVPGEQHLPRTFDLLFEIEEVVRVIEGVWRPEKKMVLRSCTNAWRNGVRLGVKFV